MDQLLFRWDFQGDGHWDTSFDTAKVVTRKFDEAGFYSPKLEVKDPSRLIRSTSKKLTVNRIDSLISNNQLGT